MNEVNFLITGDIAAIHSGQTTKPAGTMDKVSQETTESFSSALSKSLLTSLLAISNPENGNLEMSQTANNEETLEDMLYQMDEILSLHLTMLNVMQELESDSSVSSHSELIPDGYYELLEDVMVMMNLLPTLSQTPQKDTEKLMESFTRLSDRVMVFMKTYLESKGDKAEQASVVVKDHKNLKELMSLIETKFFKLPPLESVGTSSPSAVIDTTTKRINYVPVADALLQNGPVTMNLLQLPKQTTIQWVLDTTTNEVAREQLLQKLEGILAKTQSRFVNGNQSMTIRLAPEHLGTLHIKLQETQHGFVAKLIVHSKAAASLLESGLTNLKQALAQTNVNMEKLEVVFQDHEQKFTQQHKGNNDDASHPKHFFNKDQNDEDNHQSFEEVLLEELEIKKAVGDEE